MGPYVVKKKKKVLKWLSEDRWKGIGKGKWGQAIRLEHEMLEENK